MMFVIQSRVCNTWGLEILHADDESIESNRHFLFDDACNENQHINHEMNS